MVVRAVERKENEWLGDGGTCRRDVMRGCFFLFEVSTCHLARRTASLDSS